jgi:hypothetical protein
VEELPYVSRVEELPCVPRVEPPLTIPTVVELPIVLPLIPILPAMEPSSTQILFSAVIPPARVSSRTSKPNPRYASNLLISYADPLHPDSIADQSFINLVEATISADGESPSSYSDALARSDADKWIAGFDAEIYRLVVKTKTGTFVNASMLPKHRRVAYARIVCRFKKRLAAASEHRVRITYGRTTPGEATYTGDLAAYTASITTVKCLLNAAVSEQANLLSTDITDFYLGTDIAEPEYMWIPFKFFSPSLVTLYRLDTLQQYNGLILMQLNKNIYGLPQAGILSQQRLISHLKSYGYTECANTSCLFQHATRNTKFSLVVDDFLIKYDKKDDADHLLSALSVIYSLRTDWHATLYLGMTIEYHIGSPTLTISMPSYVQNALKSLGATDIGYSDTPMITHNISYGSKQSQVAHIDTSPILNTARTKRLQVIRGTFLYYSRTLDFRIATAVNRLSSRQAKPTEEVEVAANRLLQFLSAHSRFSITYRRSDMRLITHADASHHSESHHVLVAFTISEIIPMTQ